MKSILLGALLPLLLLLSGCDSKPVAAPTSFEPFVASDKSFAGSGPAGWDKQEFGGGDTYAKVAWTRGDAKIEVKSDTANSLMGDINKVSGKKPVDTAHDKILAGMQSDVSGFTPLPTQSVTTTFGEGRLSEWTANGTHGLRGTAMALDRSIGLNCQCSESDWETLKPAFMKVWSDLKPATP